MVFKLFWKGGWLYLFNLILPVGPSRSRYHKKRWCLSLFTTKNDVFQSQPAAARNLVQSKVPAIGLAVDDSYCTPGLRHWKIPGRYLKLVIQRQNSSVLFLLFLLFWVLQLLLLLLLFFFFCCLVIPQTDGLFRFVLWIWPKAVIKLPKANASMRSSTLICDATLRVWLCTTQWSILTH